MKQYIFLDLETSGLDTAHGELIALSALRVGKEDSECFYTLLRPSVPLSEIAEKLTGLTNDCLSQAPAAMKAVRNFEDWRKMVPIVLCRPEFDLPFLAAAYDKAGLELRSELIHTLEENRVRSMLWNHLFCRNTGNKPGK